MRRIRLWLGLGLIAGLGLGGCSWANKEVRPPPPPEEFKAPPESDPRYGNPQEYPKDTLDQADPAKTAGGGGSKKMGGMGGMGGGPPGQMGGMSPGGR
jgi:hypothetical protein